MRRPTLLAALIVLVSGITGLSQGEVITKAEFDAVNNAATHPNLRWKGVGYRSIIRTETTSSIGKQFDYASRSVTEFGSDGASHSLYESRMASGEPKRSETVWIGDTTYSRTGNAAWIRKTGSVKLGGGEGASKI